MSLNPPTRWPEAADAPEVKAMSKYLAARERAPGSPLEREALGDLLCVLRVTEPVDRIRDAFARRLARQQAQGDVKGAHATQSALRLIEESVR